MAVHLDWNYTDRDELTDEEIDEEGFSANDDFFWKGALPLVWKEALHALLHGTRWGPETATRDSSLSITVTESTKEDTPRSPLNHSEWEYFLQEVVQAIYEAAHRERPLRLAYLKIWEGGKPLELRWEASFLHRRFTVTRATDKPPQEQTLPWQQLRPMLQAWYVPDYHSERAERGIPRQAGEYLDPGDGHWYQLGRAATNPGKHDAIEELRTIVRGYAMLPQEGNP